MIYRSTSSSFLANVGRRFEGLVQVHDTFVLRDLSDHRLEFKFYDNLRMMF